MRLLRLLCVAALVSCHPAVARETGGMTPSELGAALEKRALATNFADLDHFAQDAVHLRGRERLKRLFHATVVYENQSDAAAFARWNGELARLAKADADPRYMAIARINTLQHGFDNGEAGLEPQVAQIVRDTPDWFVKVHGLTIMAMMQVSEDKSGEGLRTLSEARALVPEGDGDARFALGEIASIRGNALVSVNDLTGSTAAYSLADFTYSEPGYPRPDFDSIYNLAQMAINLGDEKLARQLAASHDHLTRRYPAKELQAWNKRLCAAVEDNFGPPQKVLDCLQGLDGDLTGAQFIAPPLLTMRAVANARLGHVALARADWARLEALKRSTHFSAKSFADMPRIEAEILTAEGHTDKAVTTLRDFYKERLSARARRFNGGVHQLTEELEAQLAVSQRNVTLQKEVIGYERWFNYIIFGLVVLVGGFSVWQVRSARQLKAARRSAEASRQAAELSRHYADRQRVFSDSIIENMPNMLIVSDAKTSIVLRVNRVAEQVLGAGRDDVVGHSLYDVVPPEAVEQVRELDRRAMAGEGIQEFTNERVFAGAEEIILRGKRMCILDEDGKPDFMLGIAEDITEQRQAEVQIARLAHYDSLTGLPNRVLFNKKLTEALAARNEAVSGAGDLNRVAVFNIDLDRFKAVNDLLGHAAGDELLRVAAVRMNACIREGDVLGRLGGDEFALVQTDVQSDEQMAAVARRIVATLSEPFSISGQQVQIGSSIGIAVAPDHGDVPEDLLKRSDLALYQSKATGRGRFGFYHSHMDVKLQARRALEVDMRRALNAGEFSLAYQPIVRMRDQRIVACEALLRWHHPERGLIPPDQFIPIAEDIGLIVALGDWVQREALHEAASWPEDMRVAINVSAMQLKSPQFVPNIITAMAQAGVAPQRVELEITESVLLDDDQRNTRVLHQLRELGIKIAMDDFGTGYSSLAYFRAFPFDKIKIDRTFTRDIESDPQALAVIRCVVGLANGLGMDTTIEGVETQAQMDRLAAEGCTEIQGYLISHPLAARQLYERLGGQYPGFAWQTDRAPVVFSTPVTAFEEDTRKGTGKRAGDRSRLNRSGKK